MSIKSDLDDLIVFDYTKEEPVDEDQGEEILGLDDGLSQEDEDEEESIPNIELQTQIVEPKASIAQKAIIKTEHKKAPKRYMLFDELVANVVDYDTDGTPIVEFSLADSEIDEKLPVECGICPSVMHKSRLGKHLKKHKVTGTNRYACIYCDETYKDYKYLAGHARRHMGIRPYVCEPCKLYFSTKQDLRVHNQRRHHTKAHICEVCGKTFAQNTMLKRHRESTHEKKRRFQCEHCPKAYYKNFSLQEHVRAVHMGKRRMLVCPFCGMQCRDAHKMARHRKQFHLNQKQFVCEVCHEQFININYFDAHKRSIQCRNNTRRRMEEDRENLSIQQLEIEQLEDESLQEVVHLQEEMEQQHNAEDSELQEYQNILHEDDIDGIDVDPEAQTDDVIIYELDVDDEQN